MRSKSEQTLYIKSQGTNDILIVSLYVDDLIFTGNNEKMIKDSEEEMMKIFEMTDLGLMHYFLGIEFIAQKKHATRLIKKFKMEGCKSNSTRQQQRTHKGRWTTKGRHLKVSKPYWKPTLLDSYKTRYNVRHKPTISITYRQLQEGHK